MADLYTVNRTQDGAQVRAELDLTTATEECAILNAQSRQQVGLTAAVYNERQEMVQPPVAIFGSMYGGAICHYEIRLMPELVV